MMIPREEFGKMDFFLYLCRRKGESFAFSEGQLLSLLYSD